jgi:hypothetical protein
VDSIYRTFCPSSLPVHKVFPFPKDKFQTASVPGGTDGAKAQTACTRKSFSGIDDSAQELFPEKVKTFCNEKMG